MRWRTLAPLLAATGCNWILGIERTINIDAPVSELPPSSRTKLVWAIATTDGMAPMGIDPELDYRPIGGETLRPEPPVILVGDDAGLTTAVYERADGSFEIPSTLRESPHRIVYTLPGEMVAHEVQWAVTGALLTIPRTTRFEAPSPPPASGYTITPIGLAGQLAAPALYTSGVFTYSNDANKFTQAASSVTFHYAQDASALTPPPGAPQITHGDWVLLTEWTGAGAQSYVNGWAKTQIDLVANMNKAPVMEPMWSTAQRTLTTVKCTSMPADCLPSPNTVQSDGRLTAAVGFGGTASRHLSYGVSPSVNLPGFLPGIAPTFIERPLLLPFVDSTNIDASITVAEPTGLGLDRVIAERISSSRTVAGVTLTSSLQTITNVFTASSLQFSAPLVTNARLGTIGLASADDVPVPVASGLQPLSFFTEAGFEANDFVITLYDLVGSSLVPVRIFHVIAPEAKIESSLLVSGHRYVFGITARTGFPSADRGDYGIAQYPFSVSTTFTRTFIVQ